MQSPRLPPGFTERFASAHLYLDLKFIRLTRGPPSPSTRPIAPIGGCRAHPYGPQGAHRDSPSAP
nr:MAG TPA: hypothetical protein [Caudoviricetes sp.]